MPILNQGNFNVTALVVPDLYVVIVPPSQLALNGVPSNSIGMVGTASWGPLNTPTSIASMASYAQTFGQINARQYDMATHAAIATQQGANNLICVRVSDGSEAAATAVVGSTNITFTGKFSGTLGNTIAVAVGTGSRANSYRFVVSVPGYTPEIFNNIVSTPTSVSTTTSAVATSSTTITLTSTTGITTGMIMAGTGVTGSPTVSSITDGTHIVVSAAQTLTSGATMTFTAANNSLWVALASAINNGQPGRPPSNWITATAGSGTTSPTLNATYTLSGGTDGISSVTAATVVGAATSPATGMYALSGTGHSILDVCDMVDPTQWTTVDSFANAESSYAVQQVANATSVSAAITLKQNAGLNSYNSKLMHGDFLWWNDPILQSPRLVAPQAFVAGRLGNLTPQLTTLNKTIYSVAGSSRSGLVGSNSVLSSYSAADIAALTLAGLDVVMTPGAGNLAIWTCRIGHNTSSDATRWLDSYPTLTNYIAKTLANGMGLYIGRTITKQLLNDISATLTYFLANLAGQGLLSNAAGTRPYAVECDTANNPPSQTNNGIVTAAVQAQYAGIMEKLVVDLMGGNTVQVTLASASNTQ